MSYFQNLKLFFQLKKGIAAARAQIVQCNQQISALQTQIAELNEKQHQADVDLQEKISQCNQQIETLYAKRSQADDALQQANEKVAKEQKRIQKLALTYKSVRYSIEHYGLPDFDHSQMPTDDDLSDIPELIPTVQLHLHSDDLKDLRRQMRTVNKAIDSLLIKYEARYTTKANLAIYRLMVIALRAELQNTLYSIKYEKLDVAIESIKKITAKYLQIASDGNQSIAGTITKFIGEIEYLFIEAVKIEYEYFVRKEKIKEEQRAIREQMRLEAEERKLLEQQRKQIEKEESKYQTEIDAITAQLEHADSEKAEAMQARIAQLHQMLDDVATKKDEIVTLQNGQAGYVYIISNIGSFGDDVYKIGMTRRLEPMDRINELSNASVPFPFDVHGMIFSDNAVSLENELHTALNERRVNRVNMRKEFFRIDMDSLERLVNDQDPTAEFTRTALAEQYRQSISLEKAGIVSIPDDSESDDPDLDDM